MGILRDLVEQKAFDIVKKRIEREELDELKDPGGFIRKMQKIL